MNSLILHSVSRILLPISVLYSLYLLWRGHNEPGGGFVGGLVLAVGVMVYVIPRGRGALKAIFPLMPEQVAGLGVLLALISGVASLLKHQAYLTHQWIGLETSYAVGTPFLFDLGVYLAVLGATMTFLFYYLES